MIVPQNKPNITMIGRSNPVTSELPVITGSLRVSDNDKNGNVLGTFNTTTFFIQSDYFVASSITIEVTIINQLIYYLLCQT